MDVFDLQAKLSLDDSGFKKGLATAGNLMLAAVGAAVAGVAALTKASVDAYANYEQLAGGVKKLFGDDVQKTVIENANNAFKTAGLSANEYMEQVTGMSASLIKSLSGDTVKAAEIADLAIRDMSDNVNTFGTDVEMVQNAYAGFARGNFTMLDNLKLGYAGSKQGMEELLEAAEAYNAEQGKMVDYSIDSYADIVQAIHDVQEAQNIAGTTAAEAATTVQGSLSMTKSAWDNLVLAFSNPDADLGATIDAFVESATTALKNLVPVVERALTGIGSALSQIAPVIADTLPGLVESLLPGLLSAVTSLINGVVAALPPLLQVIADEAPGLINSLVEGIGSQLPAVLEAAINIIKTLAIGLGNTAPTLIPTVIDIILQLAQTLVDNALLLIEPMEQLMSGLADGILASLPAILETIPPLIEGITTYLIENTAAFVECGIILFSALVENAPAIIDALIPIVPDIIDALINAFTTSSSDIMKAGERLFTSLTKDKNIVPKIVALVPKIIEGVISPIDIGVTRMVQAGYNFFMGLIQNIGSVISNITGKAREIVSNIVNSISSGVSQMASVGANLITGLWSGISQQIGWLLGKIAGVASQVTSTVKKVFKVASPSKVFAEIGGYLAEGLAIGWEDGYDDVQKTINDDIDLKGVQNTNPIKFEYAGQPQLAGAGGVGDIVIPVYIGQQKLDTIILNAQRRTNLKSGGRS